MIQRKQKSSYETHLVGDFWFIALWK